MKEWVALCVCVCVCVCVLLSAYGLGNALLDNAWHDMLDF